MNRHNKPILPPTLLLGCAVFAVLWLVYFLSATRGGDPTAGFDIFLPAVHLDWRIPRKAPLWFGIAFLVGKSSVAAVLPVLHWVSITCGALAGGLVAAFTAGLRPPNYESIRYQSTALQDGSGANVVSVPMLVAGAIAGLSFGLYPPFWLDVIRATPTALHIVFLLVCMHLSRSAMRRQSRPKLYLFCFLYGLGMSSYPTMLCLFPIFGVLVLLLSTQWEETRGAEMLKCVFFGALGSTGFLIIPLFLWLSPYRDAHQLASFAEAMRFGLQGQWIVIKIALFSFMGILPTIFCLLPFGIFIALPRSSSEAWTKLGGVVLRGIFTLIGAFFLLAWPVDLQTLYGASYVVVFPIMITSIWFGFLIADWIMGISRKWQLGDRLAAFAYAPMLLGILLPLVMLGIFFPWVHRRHCSAAEYLAKSLQENIPDSTQFLWVDPTPYWNDTYLQYALLAAGKDTYVININHLNTPYFQEFLRRRFPDVNWPQDQITLPDEWLQTLFDREPTRQSVAILADPEAILSAGLDFRALPCFFLAEETPNSEQLLDAWHAANTLYQQNHHLLDSVTQAMVDGTLENPRSRLPEKRYPLLRARYAGLGVGLPALRHISRAYNDIGFLLHQAEYPKEAKQAFELALQIYPDNPSPVGNLAMLEAPGASARLEPGTSTPTTGSAAFNALRLRFSNTFERELKRWPSLEHKDLIFALPGNFGFISDPTLFAHMAGFYFRRFGNTDRAIAATKLARNVSKLGKDNFSAMLGDFLMVSGAPDEARQEWERLLETNPDNLQLRIRLAGAYLGLGDYTQVEEVLAGIEAGTAPVLRTLAKAMQLQEQGDFEASLTAINQLAEERPQDPLPQVILAQMAFTAEEYAKARSHMAKAKRAGYAPFEADIFDTRIALAKGTPDEAERASKLVERLLQAAPNDTRVLDLKVTLSMNQGETDEARTWAEKLVSLNKNSPTGYRALGLIALMNGQRADAIQYYQRAVLLQKEPGTLNNLAYLYLERGDLPLAEVTAREGLKLAPEDPFLLDTLGSILDRSGKPEDALSAFRKACEGAESLPPQTQATLYYHLGTLLARSDDPVRLLEAKAALNNANEVRQFLDSDQQTQLDQALKKVND